MRSFVLSRESTTSNRGMRLIAPAKDSLSSPITVGLCRSFNYSSRDRSFCSFLERSEGRSVLLDATRTSLGIDKKRMNNWRSTFSRVPSRILPSLSPVFYSLNNSLEQTIETHRVDSHANSYASTGVRSAELIPLALEWRTSRIFFSQKIAIFSQFQL